ncbi:MAG: Twin-arginine translocation pathway signal [Betaproteobacteria bacterium HGW-Betaproteobacteria-17]|nr:MAG: Twin-arginine translocation pathway signal [Betaproteobacteria bacterium HGW-Betaproteobacteria-17]
MKHCHNRRKFLKLGMLAAALPLPAFASQGLFEPERRLGFHSLHTGEKAELPYWIEGEYVPESLAEINHVLRDHRTGEVAAIDTQLLDLLHRVSAAVGASRPFQVISGYRSPASNQMLAKNSSGVATRSLHMQGKAIDARLPGIALADLRNAGLMLRGGGVGYYPGSDFVHLDVGRVRSWGG